MKAARFTDLSDEELDWVHAASEAFEQALTKGEPGSIATRVDDAPEKLRTTVFEELLAIEIEIRSMQGESFSQAEYETRFPDRRQQIEIVFERVCDQTEETNSKSYPAKNADVTHGPETSGELGRFQVIRPHAKGGLGEVSLAQDRQLHRDVALKQIHPRFANDKAIRQRFLLEAEITGRLEHPGVVPVYGLGKDKDGRPYYAMRFIEGDSLRVAADQLHNSGGGLEKERLQLRKLLRRFITVCNTIQYAHSRGVLHRDLKPSNIMLGDYGETLVVDWGLAKLRNDRESEDGNAEADAARLTPVSGDSLPTVLGTAIGTPAFMPPEQAAGRMDDLGPTSDVFSLGATLYYLLTGQPPHVSNDLDEVLKKAQQGEFKRPRDVKADIPAALDAICLKAMSTQQQNRYTDPRQLGDELDAYLAGEPAIAHSEGLTTRFQRWVRKHPKSVAGLAASVMVGLIGAVTIATIVARNNQDLQALTQTAQLEATEADLIRDFFVHHLRPSQLGEASVEYENRGDAVIDLQLRSPFRRAEIVAQLGEIFANLGDLVRAEKHLLKAEAICNQLPEASTAERRDKSLAIAENNFYLGRLRHIQGRDDEALRRLASALESSHKAGLDHSDARVFQATFDLNLVMNNTKSMHDAERRSAEFAEVHRVLAEQAKQRSDVPKQLAVLKFVQAAKKFHEGEFAPVLQQTFLQAAGYALMEESRKLCADLPDGNDTQLMLDFYDVFVKYELNKSRSPLSSFVRIISQDTTSEAYPHKQFVQDGQTALAAVRRAFAKEISLYYDLMFAKSVNDVQLKRRLLLNNVDASRTLYGKEPGLAHSLYALAEFLEEQKEFEEAELQLKAVIDLQQNAFDDQPHWRIGHARLQLGRFLARRKRWQDAADEFRHADVIFVAANVADYSELGVACRVDLDECLEMINAEGVAK